MNDKLWNRETLKCHFVGEIVCRRDVNSYLKLRLWKFTTVINIEDFLEKSMKRFRKSFGLK